MGERAIDYNRGVSIRQHQKTGMQVFMYKDTPGVYLNVYGNEVSEELAQEAGFDTDKLGKLRLRRERMAEAMSAIEADLAMDSESKVVKEKDGIKIVSWGSNFHVQDEEGRNLTTMPVPRDQADLLLDKLTAPKKSAREKAPKEVVKE